MKHRSKTMIEKAVAVTLWAIAGFGIVPVQAQSGNGGQIPFESESSMQRPVVLAMNKQELIDAPAKTANARRAATGPGTQTEDDVYVGVTKKDNPKARKRTKDCGKDCDDLEVERIRRK
jgi:hypothetical protein